MGSSSMSTFTTREITTREDLDKIVDLTWISHYTPYRPFVSATLAVFGPTKADREKAIADSKERFWKIHSANPSSHWTVVEDTVTGAFVGATQWMINKTNPFPNGPQKMVASWWPEGSEGREFVSAMLTQAYRPRQSWMRRPCIVLNIMSVLPQYRRHGLGSLMMKWGEEQAQELGLECWTEASELGRFLYERYGYRVLLKYALDPERPDASDEWKKLAHELLPQVTYAMWKPAGGVWAENTVMPWDLGVKE